MGVGLASLVFLLLGFSSSAYDRFPSGSSICLSDVITLFADVNDGLSGNCRMSIYCDPGLDGNFHSGPPWMNEFNFFDVYGELAEGKECHTIVYRCDGGDVVLESGSPIFTLSESACRDMITVDDVSLQFFSFSQGLGGFLIVVVILVLSSIASLIGIGWGYRKVKNKVTGNKF